jgi:superfamily II DNA or RNA helicase
MWTKLTFAAVLVLGATPALATNWSYIGKNTFGSVYEVDLDSLTRDGSTATFHLRVRYGPDGPKGESDGYVATRRANCSDRSYSDLTTDYMKDGKVLRTSGAEETRTATASSIAGEVLKRVCGN